jgi:type III restriction enzyme
MKFKFDANQQYQKDAIESIVDIFDGQELRQSEFTAFKHNSALPGMMNELGYGNKLDLSPEDLLKNVITIQDRNKLPRSKSIIDAQYGLPNFAIEMETGTGKTYVYTRTIMELNHRYGMTKFIIVVPSVAIREGVKKSLDVTLEHFSQLYPGQSLEYFIYDSKRLNRVRSFATSDAIEVMIINIDAFRKSFSQDADERDLEKTVNLFHKPSDQLSGRAPKEFVQQTNPIVIIDEPQSVDNTKKAKEAIQSLNPLCILRYSATHKDAYNLMYRLGPVEAHDQKLVKTIEVLSVQDDDAGKAHVKVLSASHKTRKAKVEVNFMDKKGVISKKSVTVKTGDDLYDLSGGNHVYNQHAVSSINCEKGNECVEFESGEVVHVHDAQSDDGVKRAQIHHTIQAHLEKELLLADKGIKVLSLFFIDKVAHYREYKEENDEAVVQKGKYAQMFEEEYLKLIKKDKYQTLFNSERMNQFVLNSDAEAVHDGYFSQDKQGVKDTKGNTKADESTYDLIMKEKERLLSFETPLRFIFSHSALKEGWDNPNVFQVCTLVETQDTFTKRQKIGRGLRLPVHSVSGERILDSQNNILTVVANESYEQFADQLQIEIESETNTKFGVIDARLFENLLLNNEPIGYNKAEKLVDQLQSDGLLDAHGKATQELKNQLALGEFEAPTGFEEAKEDIENLMKSVTRRLPVLDAKEKVLIRLNKQKYLSEDFQQLWNRIKHKTVYRLNFDPSKLQEVATEEVKMMRPIKPNAIIAKYVDLRVEKEGVTFDDPHRIHTFVRENYKDGHLPNVLSYVEQYTKLKRSTLARILIDSGRLDELYTNPQVFMEQVVEAVKSAKRQLILDGIEYQKIGDNVCWSQELFESEELIGYLNKNALEVENSIYTHVVYDSSTIEKPFAERLNADEDVKLFVKLPGWFKVETPLGSYNPDWAIVLDKNGTERLYFVVETKGSLLSEDLRATELAKIKCGKKHFAAISDDVVFEQASDYDFWRKSH